MALTFVNQIGAVEGLNQAAPGTLIPDSFVRWSQDVLFDRAGLIRRRGPFSKFDTFDSSNAILDVTYPATTGERVLGVFSTYDPNGTPRIGMLVNTTVASQIRTVFRVFSNSFVLLGQEVLVEGDFVEDLSVVSAKPALGGGLWISLAGSPSLPTQHYQFFWRGGYGAYTVSTPSASVTSATTGTGGFTVVTPTGFDAGHGSLGKEVTVTSTTSLSPGMFVYTGDYYLGIIKTIKSATKFELEKHPFMWTSAYDSNHTGSASGELGNTPGNYTSGVSLTFYSVRPYIHTHGRGLMSLTSTTLVSGLEGSSGEGHWLSAGVLAWYLYRASDNAFIGKVDAVTTNINATIHATAGITIKGDEYVMAPIVASPRTESIVSNRTAEEFAGLYTAVYAGYQWYGNLANDDANINRVVFSASHEREAVDLSRDSADSIIFPGKSQFRGMGASSTGLLVFLEDRTYILRGNDRSNFSVEQLVPEGCLCASSIVEYGGGVFWAGKSGIMFYDGASVRNLTQDNLGLYYTDSLDTFDPEQDRIIGFIHKNNLMMTFTSWKSPFGPVRYEPIYAADRLTTSGIADRTLQDFADSGFTYDDLNTQNNVPIFWDRKILNTIDSSSAMGVGIKWGNSITNVARATGEATITTALDHNLIVGDNVIISGVTNDSGSFNGSFVVSSIIDPSTLLPSTTKFRCANTAGTATVTTVAAVGVSITSVARAAGIATFTTNLAHNLTVGSTVTVSGITNDSSSFNGVFTVVSMPTTTTFTCTNLAGTATVTTVSATGTIPVLIKPAVTYGTSRALYAATTNIQRYGPLRSNTSITFSVYLPTNALTTLSNMDFRGATSIETIFGLKTILGVNSVESSVLRARFIDVHPVYDTNTNGEDELLVEKINIPVTDLVKGPDFYLQTKHYTVGDPILRKWFRKIMLSMLLYDGAIRMDLVDDDDNDSVDINLKKPRYWDVFTELGYDWDYLDTNVFPKITSPNKSIWLNVESAGITWDEVFTANFNRYVKRISWRYSSVGFRLYQLNNYKKPYNGTVTRPTRVEMQGFTVGFTPLRAGRV